MFSIHVPVLLESGQTLYRVIKCQLAVSKPDSRYCVVPKHFKGYLSDAFVFNSGIPISFTEWGVTLFVSQSEAEQRAEYLNKRCDKQ